MTILRKIFAFLIDTAQTLLLAAAVFLVIYVFLFRPFQVSGQSMFPNFHDKEYVLTNLIVLRLEEPKRGDVVVFKAPNDPEKDFIKRVIATPGDTVSLKNGEVYVNSEKLDESAYLKENVKTYGGSFLREDQEVVVPNDSYFLMGDNRQYSSDSREWGLVKKDGIIGSSLFVYWPPDRSQLIKNPFGE